MFVPFLFSLFFHSRVRLYAADISSLKTLAGEPFVQFHRVGAPSLFDEVIGVCRRAGFSPRIVNEPNFMATVMTLVESGLGVSLIPSCVRSLNPPHVIIRPITPGSADIPLCAIWPKSADNPALAAFVEILRTAKPAIRTQMEARNLILEQH